MLKIRNSAFPRQHCLHECSLMLHFLSCFLYLWMTYCRPTLNYIASIVKVLSAEFGSYFEGRGCDNPNNVLEFVCSDWQRPRKPLFWIFGVPTEPPNTSLDISSCRSSVDVQVRCLALRKNVNNFQARCYVLGVTSKLCRNNTSCLLLLLLLFYRYPSIQLSVSSGFKLLAGQLTRLKVVFFLDSRKSGSKSGLEEIGFCRKQTKKLWTPTLRVKKFFVPAFLPPSYLSKNWKRKKFVFHSSHQI
jgi:hypothetical protein